jgi:hypothetical protein
MKRLTAILRDEGLLREASLEDFYRQNRERAQQYHPIPAQPNKRLIRTLQKEIRTLEQASQKVLRKGPSLGYEGGTLKALVRAFDAKRKIKEVDLAVEENPDDMLRLLRGASPYRDELRRAHDEILSSLDRRDDKWGRSNLAAELREDFGAHPF